MARRWVCPQCGTGRLAPERMAQDDTRRYCLECSATSPRLVAMECPALERRRETKRQARLRKAREERERKREEERQRYSFPGGQDARELFREVQTCGAWSYEGPKARRAARSLEFQEEWLGWSAFQNGDPYLFVYGLASVLSSRVAKAMRWDDSNRLSIRQAALSRYFDVDTLEAVRQRNVRDRLEGRGKHNATSVSHTIIDMARAKGHFGHE